MTAVTQRTERRAAGRRRRLNGGNVRRATIRLHKWVALTVGLWIVVECVSGSLLVFSDQIDAWSRPDLFTHTRGDIGPQAASTAAAAAIPHAAAAGVQLPANERGVYVVTVSVRVTGAPRTTALPPQRLVYVDPGTGHVNGVRDPAAGFTPWLQRLHRGLLQTKIAGIKGSTLVGWLGVTAIFVVLTGSYLWLWPAVRKASTLFRLRRKTPMVFALDLHRLVGIVVFPFLLVALVTGVNMTFGKELRQAWYAITPGQDKGARSAITAPKSAPHDPITHRISLDEVRDRAAAATHGRVDSISSPFSATGTFAVRITRGWDPASGPRGRGGNLTAYVDQFDGSVLRVVKPSDYPVAGQAYEYWAAPVHFGTEGGMATRVLLDLTGVATLAMIGSGIWLTVVRLRKRARRKVALGAALPALPATVLDETTQQSWIDTVPAGRTVVREGAVADAFYVILNGEFDVFEGATHMRTLGPGDSFGQIGLLITGTRTASVVARSGGEVVVVPTEEFDIILQRARRDGVDLTQAGLDYSTERWDRTPGR